MYKLYFKSSPSGYDTYQDGEPLCYLEAILLYARKTELKMPKVKAKIMAESKLGFLYRTSSIILGLSTAYILVLLMDISWCNRASNNKGHDVPTLSLEW